MLRRRLSARIASPLRRWMRFSWLDRIPFLADWINGQRSGRRRTADDGREPRQSIKPTLSHLETRFIPNDILGALTGGPLLGTALALTSGFVTPNVALFRGWGANRPPQPELPGMTGTPVKQQAAALDALFASGTSALWHPATDTSTQGVGSPAPSAA
jgi:hypothetical protein